MDNAVDLFAIVDDDLRAGSALALSSQLSEASSLCGHFETSARSADYKSRAREELATLRAAASRAQAVLSTRQPWREETLRELEERGLGEFFGSLQKLMNLSDSEVAESIAKNLGLMATAITDLRDGMKRYRLEGLVANVDSVSAVVVRSLRNRVTVTPESESATMETLSRAASVLEQNLPRVKQLSADQSDEQLRLRLCDECLEATRAAQSVLSRAVVGSAVFVAPSDVQAFGTVRAREHKARETLRKVRLSDWDVERVVDLFARLGASEAETTRLRQESIDGQALVLLSNEELGSELGLKLGVRKKYANWLINQEQPSSPSSPSAPSAPSAPAPVAPTVAATPSPSKPRPGPAVRPGASGPSKIRGAATIRRQSAQVDAELASMLAGLDDI